MYVCLVIKYTQYSVIENYLQPDVIKLELSCFQVHKSDLLNN